MPTLMLPVFKNDPNAGDWLEGFDVFVIDITPQLARSYLAVMDTVAITAATLKLHGMDLYQFQCWDSNGQWFPGNPDADPVINGEYGDECQPPLPGAEPSRTEGDLGLISEQSLMWAATPKHTEILVETASISRTQLEQIAVVDVDDLLGRVNDALSDSPDREHLLDKFVKWRDTPLARAIRGEPPVDPKSKAE